MNIFVSGVNYRTTPLPVREKLSFDSDRQQYLLKSIRKIHSVSECAMLSTCNRTEVYVHSAKENFDFEAVEEILCQAGNSDLYDLKKYFYFYNGTKAVRHLFKVASGLDSMVLGEDQILGQIKHSYSLSRTAKTSSGVLNTLFREAITTAKKVKTSTGLSKNPLSIGSLSVKVISDAFEGRLENKNVLMIGTGEIGILTLKHLSSKPVGKIYVTNRTHAKADSLANEYENVIAVDYNHRYEIMDDCDIIISSTSSPHYTITRDVFERSLKSDKLRVVIDLAVPRDIDSNIKEIKNVQYLNIDDLKPLIDKNMSIRYSEASKAEEIIEGFVTEFEKWYEFRKALPVVKQIQTIADHIVRDRLKDTLSKLKITDEEQKDIIKIALTGTVNEIMYKFIYSVRECSEKEDIKTFFKCMQNMMDNESDS